MTFKDTVIFINTAIRTSNLSCFIADYYHNHYKIMLKIF